MLYEVITAPFAGSVAAPPESKARIIRKPLNYLTSLIAQLVTEAFDGGDDRVRYDDFSASSSDRAIGTNLAGAMTRGLAEGRWGEEKRVITSYSRHYTKLYEGGVGARKAPQKS